MKINLLFEGANVERSKQQRLSAVDGEIRQPLTSNREIVGEFGGKAFTFTLSDEMKYLKAATDEEIAQMFAQQVEDPSDIFSYRPQDQWLVFSQYLHDNGQFDGRSVTEMEEIENLLVDITDGLDNLNIATQKGRDLKIGSKAITQQLTSAEAQLELGASIAALQLFNEKYVTGEVKEGFQLLIDSYTKRNESQVLNYRSIEEKFYRGRSEIFETRKLDTSSLDAERRKQLMITNKLGKSNFTEAEITQMMDSYREQFGRLQNISDVDVLMVQLKEQLASFVTKGISKQDQHYDDANHFVKEKSAKSFECIADYWKKLIV